MTEAQFNQLVAQAIDSIPEKYAKRLNNVFFTSEDQPSPEQRRKLQLAGNQSLYGLYEGIPLTKRGAGYNLVLPDKITLFRTPILSSCSTYTEVEKLIQQTVWHEVAHYFGLNHDQIHELEQKDFSQS